MHVWFWAWVLVAVATAVVAVLARDKYSQPWAGGAVVAALLEAAGIALAWQWAAFFVVSLVVFVAANRVRYAGRHARARSDRRSPGRHSASSDRRP